MERVVPFPAGIKEMLDEYVKGTRLDIVYTNGKIISIKKTNIEIIVPHFITFIGTKTEQKFIYYGDLDENKNRFYTIDLKEELYCKEYSPEYLAYSDPSHDTNIPVSS